MTPTCELRFVKRHIDCDNGPDKKRGRLMMILQQKWIEDGAIAHGRVKPRHEEWRDVPVADE